MEKEYPAPMDSIHRVKAHPAPKSASKPGLTHNRRHWLRRRFQRLTATAIGRATGQPHPRAVGHLEMLLWRSRYSVPV